MMITLKEPKKVCGKVPPASQWRKFECPLGGGKEDQEAGKTSLMGPLQGENKETSFLATEGVSPSQTSSLFKKILA